ncbi:MAG: N-6 DNA methylase [Lachnospiraceae bacterium]|nr:N-6 DNA methylase [Butyrivibrio sp.]MCM1342982.1 N-6 DNA methylase [Muribaculaceae bacterium]MCM1410712.1 N-6 DNA methylase [Lachnospiraceae bacterium]
MVDKKRYGVVYTPDKLAEFTAELLYEECGMEQNHKVTILDPACGESALLLAMKGKSIGTDRYIGIDVDKDIINANIISDGEDIDYFYGDFLIQSGENSTLDFWRKKIGQVDCVIANPPWSCERLYKKDVLSKEGFTLADGQYDNYFLFVEQSLKILKEGGKAAFILPDSVFSDDAIKLRAMLCKKTHILIIARLGEKIFPNVNRATTIVIVENELPTDDARTKCFRLGTKERKKVLSNEIDLMDCYLTSVHEVNQSRFAETEECLFDIDLYEMEENLITKLERDKIDWNTKFSFGRGVEISKSGNAVICKECNSAQGYTKTQKNAKNKVCTNCGKMIDFADSKIIKIISERKKEGMREIYVGENIHRYMMSGHRYLMLGVQGINYKGETLYMPPKILIRKTGLGINAFLDKESTYISQTVYSCQYIDKEVDEPMEYYLALLNSRVIYYYYLKKYGENEWKSHPYLTKKILFTLPLKKYVKTRLSGEICQLALRLLVGYDKDVDMKLEKKIFELYGLTDEEILTIMDEINRLPDLSAINHMKFSKEEFEKCTDI